MDELARLARLLADRLGATDGGVLRPVSVAAVRGTILPYRGHRKALGLSSVEDYETILLRLVAEERGYVRTTPRSAAERCQEELGSSNPDLAVLEQIADATIQFTSMAAGKIVDDEPAGATPAPAPPKAESPKAAPAPALRRTAELPAPAPEMAPSAPQVTAAAADDRCRHCRNPVPGGRQVVFCPWCGQRLIPFSCSRCGTELDSDWRHCITCGAPVKDPYHFV
jgi:hypothetical protein